MPHERSLTYLGLAQVVVLDCEEPDVKLDRFGGSSGTYAGLDRFGRVVDQKWRDYGASADRDRIKYGYDRASSRIWRVMRRICFPRYVGEGSC